MADAMPDYFVEQQRVISQIAAQENTIQRQRLDIMEMDARKRKSFENIKAAKEAIVSMKETLASLIDTHGQAAELEEL